LIGSKAEETLSVIRPHPDRAGSPEAIFDVIARSLQSDGPAAALDRLVTELDEAKNYRALLDALLLRARHDLGLPLIHVGSLTEISEPARTQYENRYVEAIRSVGTKFLESGDLIAAWPYFRAIGETDPIAKAIDDYQSEEGLDEKLGQVIEIAFNQGANLRRGWELILNNYGTCSAITAFEQIPPQDHATRTACADTLVRHMHRQLLATLKAEVVAHGDPEPVDGATLESICEAHPWIFEDEAYHIDVSHLSASVRTAVGLSDQETIALAADLCAYGRRLSDRLQFEGDPPFERTFEDHGAYFNASLGRDVDAAIDRFRAKIESVDKDSYGSSIPAQVLVNLLTRVGRVEQAIDVATEHLSDLPESSLICPGVAQLCQRLHQPERLAGISKRQGDPVNFTAALIASSATRSSPPV
jgi:hypothetical protein